MTIWTKNLWGFSPTAFTNLCHKELLQFWKWLKWLVRVVQKWLHSWKEGSWNKQQSSVLQSNALKSHPSISAASLCGHLTSHSVKRQNTVFPTFLFVPARLIVYPFLEPLSSPTPLQAILPFPACFAVPEAPAAPCPVQSPAVPLKTVKSAWLIIIIIGKRASCSVAMGTSDLWFCKCKQSLSIFREERREGRRGDWGRRGVLDACPQNMILSSEVSSPVLQALSCVPPSLLPTIRLLFCPYSSPSLCSMEHCFLISVGFKGVWGHRVSSIVHADCGFMNKPIVSIVLSQFKPLVLRCLYTKLCALIKDN